MHNEKPRLRSGFFFRHRRALAFVATIALLGFAGCSSPTSPDALTEPLLKSFGRSTLQIKTETTTHNFSVYIANSPAQRRQGLMYVEDMPDDAGMLFVYDQPNRVSMWMKNTVMSLDMLFVKSNGVIESIARNTTPGSLKSIAAQDLVCCVLELKAGISDALGLKPGDRLIHETFSSQ